ncbi:gamma-glutamyltransferase [Amnibacterium flavum]|uniref:gamma-glutamyltransferase n=1 Tax=Amnibacterium flavum TaxID=2173173 RepID=UPI00140217C9|nr:gamma-glutamyltransferase [Amnibacterium flavum]
MRRQAAEATGPTGSASTAHPIATEAALAVLAEGGSAVDAAIAAHLVLAVVAPQATGVGGDLLALVHSGDEVVAFGGTGLTPASMPVDTTAAGATVTVPGFLAACADMHRMFGRLPWERLFEMPIALADGGIHVDGPLHDAAEEQRSRLQPFASSYALLGLAPGDLWRQPELAALLRSVSIRGARAFYEESGGGIASAVASAGGAMQPSDLIGHETMIGSPISSTAEGIALSVQPAPTQGVLLAMAFRWIEGHRDLLSEGNLDHLLVEATGAAFEFRDDAFRGAGLLDEPLAVSLDRATRRDGPRAYLHTAGVATADADGLVVSSLSSVFDDFGSAVLVPELGIVLNNRAEGFTAGANSYRPGARPVHTLAPAMVETADGVMAIATPGADGQVQTLLAILTRHLLLGMPLADAVSRPRWRSQSGDVLVERSFPEGEQAGLIARGHRVVVRPDGIDAFGAVVAAGSREGTTWSLADWRRQTETGAV